MSEVTIQQKRTGWDIVWGILLILGGLFVLGNAVLATAVSVTFVAWMAFISGIIALVAAFTRIGKKSFWPSAISGVLLTILGLLFLRHLGAAAVTLTLLAGGFFLVSGLLRIIAASTIKPLSAILIIGGIASVFLGIMVLFDFFTASFTLLGVLLGVQILIDGISLLIEGRTHVDVVEADTKE
jgi:uncharacterized membrane protein HdeD (DUF308 family)